MQGEVGRLVIGDIDPQTELQKVPDAQGDPVGIGVARAQSPRHERGGAVMNLHGGSGAHQEVAQVDGETGRVDGSGVEGLAVGPREQFHDR